MEKILVTGGSGLIGRNLIDYLLKDNKDVYSLSRTRSSHSQNTYQWDIENGVVEEDAFENLKSIVHLAGAGIAEKRWTDKRKKEIIDSRVRSAQLLFDKIIGLKKKPDTFITASAIGYYGAVTSEKIFKESDPPGNDFQAEVCSIWESTSKKFEEIGIRTIQLRFGIVLSIKGGALKKMFIPTKIGIGSPLGSGKQYFPWIHINDVVKIIEKCIREDKMSGSFNVVTTQNITQAEFAESLAKVLKRPFFAPNIPSFLLKLMFGEMSSIILEGSRISPQKLIDAGYKFNFTEIDSALTHLVRANM